MFTGKYFFIIKQTIFHLNKLQLNQIKESCAYENNELV